jgi:hypothetical protein
VTLLISSVTNWNHQREFVRSTTFCTPIRRAPQYGYSETDEGSESLMGNSTMHQGTVLLYCSNYPHILTGGVSASSKARVQSGGVSVKVRGVRRYRTRSCRYSLRAMKKHCEAHSSVSSAAQRQPGPIPSCLNSQASQRRAGACRLGLEAGSTAGTAPAVTPSPAPHALQPEYRAPRAHARIERAQLALA